MTAPVAAAPAPHVVVPATTTTHAAPGGSGRPSWPSWTPCRRPTRRASGRLSAQPEPRSSALSSRRGNSAEPRRDETAPPATDLYASLEGALASALVILQHAVAGDSPDQRPVVPSATLATPLVAASVRVSAAAQRRRRRRTHGGQSGDGRKACRRAYVPRTRFSNSGGWSRARRRSFGGFDPVHGRSPCQRDPSCRAPQARRLRPRPRPRPCPPRSSRGRRPRFRGRRRRSGSNGSTGQAAQDSADPIALARGRPPRHSWFAFRSRRRARGHRREQRPGSGRGLEDPLLRHRHVASARQERRRGKPMRHGEPMRRRVKLLGRPVIRRTRRQSQRTSRVSRMRRRPAISPPDPQPRRRTAPAQPGHGAIRIRLATRRRAPRQPAT